MKTQDTTTNKPHYIAMSGVHGCLPNDCQVFENVCDATNYLTDLFDLSPMQSINLEKNRYLELSLKNDFADYCEITVCDCDDPSIHSDSGEFDPE